MPVNDMNAIARQDVNLCYQCQKCTATCPVASYMDVKPDVVVRKVSLGAVDELLRSKTIWLCTGCETCGSRCPNLISVGAINETLRERCVREGVTPAVASAAAVHHAFLASIERFGIVHEASMLAEFKLRTRDFFSDLALGLKMFLKGKIPLRPHRIKGLEELRGIMRGRK